MNESTHAVTLVTSAFPFITKAINELLLDNGCVNRTEPLSMGALTLNMWGKIKERYYGEDFPALAVVEAELAALTQSEFEEAVIGEQGVVKLSGPAEFLLNFVFEAL